IRDVEKRLELRQRWASLPKPMPPFDKPANKNKVEDLPMLYELIALALQTDSTRIATFLMANEGSNRSFPELEIPEGHHFLTHHQGRKEMIEKVAEIDLWYMKQLGKFLEKMEQTKDIDGKSLLHNSMIVYGSGNSDGNRHTHVNLPVLLAGGGGGTLNPGRVVKSGGVPMSNLLLSMADRMGVNGLERHGDSTGRFEMI
ncbi:MAG TPA: DUF1552 domain-containing protein, partial [Verrucomicrobiae bacterium]